MTVKMEVPPAKPVKAVERKRYYSQKDKYQIVQEAIEKKDMLGVAEKYHIHRATLYLWKKQIEYDPDSFLSKPADYKRHRELVALQKEIRDLKEVIVMQAEEINLLKKGMKLLG